MASMKNFENQSMSPGEYLKNFAEQMLLHSRGCSGVILSLFMQGFAETVANDDFSKENVYKALENGCRNAYEGTENPREGTMLTLMRALKEKYGELMEQEDDPIVIIGKTIPYLKEVLDKTPEMLPVLKQAGVIAHNDKNFLFHMLMFLFKGYIIVVIVLASIIFFKIDIGELLFKAIDQAVLLT
jgi:dihydroxyacetone kinase-like predicted kinase